MASDLLVSGIVGSIPELVSLVQLALNYDHHCGLIVVASLFGRDQIRFYTKYLTLRSCSPDNVPASIFEDLLDFVFEVSSAGVFGHSRFQTNKIPRREFFSGLYVH